MSVGIDTNVLIEVFEAGAMARFPRRVRDRQGLLVELGRPCYRERKKNKVPLSGRNVLRDLLGRAIPGFGAGFAPTHFAVGTDATVTTDGHTALGTEVFREQVTTRQAFSARVVYQAFLGTNDANGNSLAEIGLFDTPNAFQGNLFARATYTPIPKTISIQVVFTWEITITST